MQGVCRPPVSWNVHHGGTIEFVSDNTHEFNSFNNFTKVYFAETEERADLQVRRSGGFVGTGHCLFMAQMDMNNSQNNFSVNDLRQVTVAPAPYALHQTVVPVSYSLADGMGVLVWGNYDGRDQNISISIHHDGRYMPGEFFKSFWIILKSPEGLGLGSISQALVAIFDDDAKTGVLQFAASHVVVDEGAGQVTIEVLRVGGTDANISVQFQTDLYIKDGAGIIAASAADFENKTGTLRWGEGDSSPKQAIVGIINNYIMGPESRYFTVLLSTAAVDSQSGWLSMQRAALLGNKTVALVEIVEDDGIGVLQFTAGNAFQFDGRNLTVQVERAGGSAAVSSADFRTVDGTLRAGADYILRSGTLSWLQFDLSTRIININLTLPANSTFSSYEVLPATSQPSTPPAASLYVHLSFVTGATVQAAWALVLLHRNAVSVGFTASNFRTVRYARSSTVSITVARTAADWQTVSITFSTYPLQAGPRSTVQGVDFLPTSGTLTWQPFEDGVKNIVITIPGYGGKQISTESEREFQVSFMTYSLLTDASLTSATVAVYEGWPTVHVAAPSGYVSQRAGYVNFTVVLDVYPAVMVGNGGVRVQYVTVGSKNSVDGVDFLGSNGSVTFNLSAAAARTTGSDGTVQLQSIVKVPLIIRLGYVYDRYLKNISLVCTNVSTQGVIDLTRQSALVTVFDPQAAVGVPAFVESNYWVDAGERSVVVLVERRDGVQGMLEISFACVSKSGLSGEDYASCSGSLEWNELDYSVRNITVALISPSFLPTEEEKIATVALSVPVSSPASSVVADIPTATIHIRRMTGRSILSIDSELIDDTTDHHLGAGKLWNYVRRFVVFRSGGVNTDSSAIMAFTGADGNNILFNTTVAWTIDGSNSSKFILNCSSLPPLSGLQGEAALNLAVVCMVVNEVTNSLLAEFRPVFANGISNIFFGLSEVKGAYLNTSSAQISFEVLAPGGPSIFGLISMAADSLAVTRSGSGNGSASVEILLKSLDTPDISPGQKIPVSWANGDVSPKNFSIPNLFADARHLFKHNTSVVLGLDLSLINPINGLIVGAAHSNLTLFLENDMSRPGDLVFLGSVIADPVTNTAVLQVRHKVNYRIFSYT